MYFKKNVQAEKYVIYALINFILIFYTRIISIYYIYIIDLNMWVYLSKFIMHLINLYTPFGIDRITEIVNFL